MRTLLHDLRLALRRLRNSPGFTLVAVFTLALGIGANTALFTVFNQVLLSKLPVHNPEELVLLGEHSKAETGRLSSMGWGDESTFAYPAYKELRDENHTLSGLAATTFTSSTLVTAKDADVIRLGLVSGNYFNLLGMRPLLGRLLVPSDDVEHAGNPVAVLSADYWQSRFGGDPGVLNQVVRINGQALTIVGVVQHRGIIDEYPLQVFAPLATEQAVLLDNYDRLTNPLDRWMVLIGRMAPGVTRIQVEADLNPLWLNWRREILGTMSHHISPEESAVWLQTHLSLRGGMRGIPMLEQRIGGLLKALEGMVLVVLVIACANVANLLLVKTMRRYGELAMRRALGASRARILQQVIVEGLLLGLTGAALGVALGWIGLKLVLRILPNGSTLQQALSLKMDWKVLLFCAGIGILTSIAFSMAPAFLSLRINLIRALHAQSNAVVGGAGKLRNALVLTEIALSMMLIAVAAVFGWTLYRLRSVDPGYVTSHVLTFHVDAAALGKSDGEVRDEYESITNEMRRQPGVRGVSFAEMGLITGSVSWSNIRVAGYAGKDTEPLADQNWVSPGFFSNMQIPLIAGREFTEHDRLGSQKVAVVDESFVKRYFGGDLRSALTGSVGLGRGPANDILIVGIIPALHTASLDRLPSEPFLYLPYDQTYKMGATHSDHHAIFYIRIRGDAGQLANAARSVVHQIDATLPITELETMDDHIRGSIFETRLMTALAMSIGALALMLAAIGLYGVLSFSVTQRTREIGIRMAVGAGRADISMSVIRQVSYLIAAGTLPGIGLGWLAVRLLMSQIDNLQRSPLWLSCGTAVGLTAAMLLAGYLPARRAAKVDPMVALRHE